MTPSSRHLNPWVLFIPSVLIVLVVAGGAIMSSPQLLCVGLGAGLALIITYFLIDNAHKFALDMALRELAGQAELANARTDEVEGALAELRDRLGDHLVECQSHSLDDVLIEIARPRSA